MKTKVRKIYGAATSSTNSVAFIDITRDSVIHGFHFANKFQPTADGTFVQWEVSLSSTAQLTTNDTNGALASVCQLYELSTNGAVQLGANVPVMGLAIPVKAGDRLYLHAVVSGSASANTCNVYVYCGE